jgi:hypothetical protein
MILPAPPSVSRPLCFPQLVHTCQNAAIVIVIALTRLTNPNPPWGRGSVITSHGALISVLCTYNNF